MEEDLEVSGYVCISTLFDVKGKCVCVCDFLVVCRTFLGWTDTTLETEFEMMMMLEQSLGSYVCIKKIAKEERWVTRACLSQSWLHT